ncbi:MAG: hypothetical protein AB7Q29_07055 [Vicinamibacterales bacterium]
MAEGAPSRATMLVLAYLWPLAVIPLLLSRDDAEIQWHAKHGLVLMAAELAAFLALSIATTIVTIVTFGLGCIVSVVFLFLWAGVLLLHIVAIVRALSGSRFIVPGVSEYVARF